MVCTVCLQCLSLQWRHNEHDGVSNHQPYDCLLSRVFRRRSKKTSKLSVTGLCAGISPVIGEFPVQMASNAENVSIWWRHHDHHDFQLFVYSWDPFIHALDGLHEAQRGNDTTVLMLAKLYSRRGQIHQLQRKGRYANLPRNIIEWVEGNMNVVHYDLWHWS